MASKVLWQHDCPGHVETVFEDGIIRVTCFVEAEPPPPDRVTDGLQTLYTFREGDGTTIHDVSDVGSPQDLVVESQAAVSWLPDGGLSVDRSTIITSTQPVTELNRVIKASNEITLEAWVKPATAAQDGPARIAAISRDFHHRNVHLAQSGKLYDVRLRTTETTGNGRPSLATPLGSVADELTHVVFTRDASGHGQLFLNGELLVAKVIGGDFSSWDDGYHLALANELTGSRAWLGHYYLVAIYDRALSPEEAGQNFQAGPPEGQPNAP